MKYKTSEREGCALDMAVAMIVPQCYGLSFKTVNGVMCGVAPDDEEVCIYFLQDAGSLSKIRTRQAIRSAGGEHAQAYSPSTDWAAGGPIIGRERITLEFCRDLRDPNGLYIHAEMDTHQWHGYWRGDHNHPLVAAMRCYVQSKLGDTADIPEH